MLDWLVGAEYVPGEGGTHVAAQGGARAVWHSTEGPTLDGAIAALRAKRAWSTLTWEPTTGRIAQHLPASASARSVQNLSGGVETNRYGIVIQIEVVAFAAHPFTDGPLIGLDRIVGFLRTNGVPDVWPMGAPLAYGPDPRRPGITPAAYGMGNGTRDVNTWLTQGGHYAHSQVPENDHGDPGAIDIGKIVQGAAPIDWAAIAAEIRRRRSRMGVAVTIIGAGLGLIAENTLFTAKKVDEYIEWVAKGAQQAQMKPAEWAVLIQRQKGTPAMVAEAKLAAKATGHDGKPLPRATHDEVRALFPDVADELINAA